MAVKCNPGRTGYTVLPPSPTPKEHHEHQFLFLPDKAPLVNRGRRIVGQSGSRDHHHFPFLPFHGPTTASDRIPDPTKNVSVLASLRLGYISTFSTPHPVFSQPIASLVIYRWVTGHRISSRLLVIPRFGLFSVGIQS